jgi:hypothetical protein
MARMVAVVLLGCVWICGPLRVEACFRVPTVTPPPRPALATKCAAIKRSQAVLRAYVKTHPCPSTGKYSTSCPEYVLDHRYPLCAGGLDQPDNIAWQKKYPDSIDKDRLEREVCRLKPRACPHVGD